MDETYDVVVVGGGAAGLAGAIALARSLRRVLVIDAGEPRNAPAAGVHNLLGREGIAPLELAAQGRREVAAYGGEVREGRAVDARRDGDDLVVVLDDGGEVRARRVLVASGLVDDLPALPGLAQRWGSEVLHCPYCHGYEVRGRRIGVLGAGPMSAHQALLFSQLSDDVVLLAHTAPPTDDERTRLGAAGVTIVEGEVVALEGEPLSGARLADGSIVPVEALVIAPRLIARSPVLDALGLVPVDHPSGMGQQYPSEAMGATTIPGVFLAGSVTDLAAQVGASAAAGTLAGAMINADLIEADLQSRLATLAAGPVAS